MHEDPITKQKLIIMTVLQMKIYARNEHAISVMTSINDIGFTLFESYVTSAIDSASVFIITCYSLVFFLLCLTIAVFISVLYCAKHRHANPDKSKANNGILSGTSHNLEEYFKQHKVVPGVAIVATLVVFVELLNRAIICIVWATYDSESNPSLILLSLYFWIPLLFIHVIMCVCLYIMCKHHYVIFVCCLLICILFYSSIPTIIILFVYPIETIAVYSFVMAYIISMIIMSALCYHFCKLNHAITGFYYTFAITYVSLIFTGMLYVLLYVLVIGRATVVGTGPLVVLSFLPSILLSGLAWSTKRAFLTDSDDSKQKLPQRIDPEKIMSDDKEGSSGDPEHGMHVESDKQRSSGDSEHGLHVESNKLSEVPKTAIVLVTEDLESANNSLGP